MRDIFYYTGIITWISVTVFLLALGWYHLVPAKYRRLIKDFLLIPHDVYWILFKYKLSDCEEAIKNINKMIAWHRKNHTPVRLYLWLCGWRLRNKNKD